MELLKVSWGDVSRMCERLASQIRSSAFSPNTIIGVSRGGLVPARLLSDILDISDLQVIRVSFYKGIGKTMEFPQLTQQLTTRIDGKRVLLVDDVSDTGRSLKVAKDHAMRMGAAEIKVATLHFKPHSEFRPDFFVEETRSWLVYPWEKHECSRELGRRV